MDFEVVGCELFGYDRSFRSTGQVSLKPEHDLTECLRATEKLPDTTTQAQLVMFLQAGERQVRLYSAMLPIKEGLVTNVDQQGI